MAWDLTTGGGWMQADADFGPTQADLETALDAAAAYAAAQAAGEADEELAYGEHLDADLG